MLTGGALKPTNYLQGGHACFTTGQLWAKRVVEASPEAYDAVVVHAGSWDATYTAFNASGLEDGRRDEVFTWRHGGPQRRAIALPWANPRAAQGQLRMPQWWFGVWTLQPQAASSALEVRPSVKLKALLPYGGLPLWCAKPQPRCDFAPPKVSTAALIPDDLPRARLRGIMSRHIDCATQRI